MKRIQLKLEPELIAQVDEAVNRMGATRSAFIADVLSAALANLHSPEQERRHRDGYIKYPVRPGEFDDWF